MIMRGKPKKGDDVSFLFAGGTERGKVTKIEKVGSTIYYSIFDGKYSYPIQLEYITKKHKKK